MATTDEPVIRVSAARRVRLSGIGGALILTSRSLRFQSAYSDAGFPFRFAWHGDLDVPLAQITSVIAKRSLAKVGALMFNVWLLVPSFRRLVQANLEVRTASCVHRFALPNPEEWVQALRPR